MSSTIFQRNIEALHRKHPQLASMLADIGETPHLQLAQTPTGLPTLAITDKHGRVIPFHNPQDPAAGAKRWVEMNLQVIQTRPLIMVFGAGLGYHLQLLHQVIKPDNRIIVVEPDPAIFVHALHVSDLSALFAHPAFVWSIGEDVHELAIHFKDNVLESRLAKSGVVLIGLPNAIELNREYIHQLSKTIEAERRRVSLQIRTRSETAAEIIRNVAANMPSVLKCGGIQSFRHKYAGRPAVVAGAGPSLADSLPELRQSRDRVFLIAADTAYPVLVKAGIEPDCIAAVDPTELNVKRLEGIQNSPALLVAHPGIHPRLTQPFGDRIAWMDTFSREGDGLPRRPSHVLEQLGISDSLGSLLCPGSTTHAAISFARFLGCAPVVLTGVDLAYPAGKKYADGVRHVDRDEMERHTVPANDGQLVETNIAYAYYLRGMPVYLKMLGVDAITTSPGAAKVSGLPYMPWSEIDFPSPAPFKPLKPAGLPHQTIQLFRERLQIALQELQEAEPELNSIHKGIRRLYHDSDPAKKAFALLRRFSDLLGAKKALNLVLSLCPMSVIDILSGESLRLLTSDQQDIREKAIQTVSALIEDATRALETVRTALQSIQTNCF